MAYVFKFEALLTFRKSLEEKAQLKLAREQSILDNHIRHLSYLKDERERTIYDFEEKKKRQMTASLFSFYMDAIRMREWEIEEENRKIVRQQQGVDKARSELLETVKDRKVIEKVREKDYREFIREQLRKAQVEGDEQVLLRFGSKAHLIS